MTLKIRIKMDNAAFEDMPGCEVARILRDYADSCECHRVAPDFRRLRDSNGNTVGEAVTLDE